MRNACIVLRKNVNTTISSGIHAVLNELFLAGYQLEEVRWLPQMEEEQVIKGIQALKADFDNVFILADKTALPIAKKYIETCAANAKNKAEFAGAMISEEGKSSVFLLSNDGSETGVQYVKTACIPYLQQRYGLRFDKIVLRAVGANHARIDQMLAEGKRLAGNALSYYHERKFDEDIIELLYNNNTPKMLADDLLRMFVEGLGDTLYALENVSLEQQLISLLKLRGKKISVAESFTGGGIAKRLVSVSGASEVYWEGINAYNEESKIKRLGVSPYTLGTMGAVSEKTAYEMALGLLNTGDCDIAIATTGLAGPKSDKNMLPVGYCCIAVGTKERICVYQYRFDGTREEISEKAINYALFLAYKQLKNV
ncbi:MAG: CinA family protein [Clostridia bacterium]|nr:CinA family protein [Clostridia bacterium]